MKRTAFVLVLALALLVVLSTTAYAEHRSSKYSTWSQSAGTNELVAVPHSGYTTTTVKCNVCHAVHNAAVMGQWIQNQPDGAWILSSERAPAQMMLRSNVAEACLYCHVDTGIAGVRLWNGNSLNWGRDPVTGEERPFDSGYGHGHTGCTNCHAVHGARAFKGDAERKILRYDATNNLTKSSHLGDPDGDGPIPHDSSEYDIGINDAVPGNVANHTYTDTATGVSTLVGIQDEIFTQDPTGVLVDPLNKAQFASLAGVIEGYGAINDAAGADMKDLQVGAFCTMCHANIYTSDSYQVINPDQDMFLAGGSFGWWYDIEGFEYQSGFYKSKGHPVARATNDFAASGSTIGTGKTVAWSGAETCRRCHDAGRDDSPPGIVYSSFPHVTPGYYKFVGAGADAMSYAVSGNKQQDMVGDSTGWLAGTEFVDAELAADGYMLYPGQNYKSDDPAVPGQTDHIGVDGQCLKCHRSGSGAGVGLTY
ncbi:MAG: hypothetical protein RQ731_03330 [Anaerosomatales bacterium]|nr:hypothetical protein [Anaerosomatales bacterium]MDT8433774.1 hypothetical protein [Anaerosomatales bacterium]